LQSASEQTDRDVVLPLLVREGAEEVVGIGAVGVERKRLAIKFFGACEISRAVVGEGLLDEVARSHATRRD
jgi:hypothetical protein